MRETKPRTAEVPRGPANAGPSITDMKRQQSYVSDLATLGPSIGVELTDPAVLGFGPDLWPYALKFGSDQRRCAVVCRPESTEAVRAVLRFADQNGLRVLPQGAGSNVVGALEGESDVLLSMERMAGIVALDETSQIVTVGAGTNAFELELELNERGLTLGIYPQSMRISTIGGWVSTRATGTYSARYGGVERAVVGVRAVTADGAQIVVPPRVRPAGGLDVLSLLVGTEGSLAVVTEVSLAVHRQQAERRLAVSFDSFAAGLRAQRELIQLELPVGLLRLYNESESQALSPEELSGAGRVLLSATVVGAHELLDAAYAAVRAALHRVGGSSLPDTAADRWFDHRFDAETLMQTRNAERLSFFDTIEVSVPWRTAEECADALQAQIAPLCATFHMHSSHVYLTGTCLYMILYVDGTSPEDLLARWTTSWGTALDLVSGYGGAVGHHHGIGSLRSGYYRVSSDGAAHRAVKAALDPKATLRARALESPRVPLPMPTQAVPPS